jgi:NAD(P)-dependent dehydrogenase (short-subunit alcohol dehydrogenase family)
MFITSMENAFSLKGKNAIVTGGQKGIGLGITQALVHQGANVAIFARDEAAANEVIKDLSAKYDVKLKFYKTDIGSHQNVKESVSRAVADFGYIDVLVNNAGIGTAGPLLDMDENMTSWFECFDIDLHGAARMCYFVAKHMRDSGKGGHIVNITSNAGEMINAPFLTAYASAKAALNHFTRCIAAELAPHNIRVNAIAPGFTKSNFTKGIPEEAMKFLSQQVPIGRFAEAIEIGALAAYLASDASDLVTGAVFTADGGFSLQH